ncbi:MAG: RNA-binding protein [Thermoplasmatales archaeon B_DKE]|nr:MAG: RNA-binding protein [Thermoplasmatales archaeon B_DKE]QRF75722.1 putative exosome complex exonuclease 2 [Thermoplasmatales archaeon]
MPKDALGVLSEIKKSFITKQIKEGRRGDGRKPDEYRELRIQTNYVPRANGSALVELGKTKILVGVKIDAGEPFPDTPNLGVFTTNVELLPMAFPTFESGPPNEMSIEVARVVDRGIRESKMIDFGKLVIEPGKKVWVVFVDINVLDFDGNLFDACSYGAVAALKTAVVPGSKYGGTDSQLPINNTPVSVTIVKLDDVMVCDPDLEEEQMSTTRITITTTEDGHIRAMQKGDLGYFEMDEIRKAIKMSSDTGSIIRKNYLK